MVDRVTIRKEANEGVRETEEIIVEISTATESTTLNDGHGDASRAEVDEVAQQGSSKDTRRQMAGILRGEDEEKYQCTQEDAKS